MQVKMNDYDEERLRDVRACIGGRSDLVSIYNISTVGMRTGFMTAFSPNVSPGYDDTAH